MSVGDREKNFIDNLYANAPKLLDDDIFTIFVCIRYALEHDVTLTVRKRADLNRTLRKIEELERVEQRAKEYYKRLGDDS